MKRVKKCVFWLGVGCVLLLGGCTLLPRERGYTLDVEFEQVLPVGWEALGRWRAVNLDEDADEEHLLFFHFDSGQVGALIYDAELAPTINQPYRLLPRYFDDQGGLGQGVIASPGTAANAITLHEVDGNEADGNEAGGNEADREVSQRELVIRGGHSHLTFVWWKGAESGLEEGQRNSQGNSEMNREGDGYGVTQLYAPGGFGGVDWEAWGREPSPIRSIVGFHPLEDYRARSYICRLVLYTRRTDLPGIVFGTLPQGLHFCNGTIPAHPFAPEGVVLAYLLSPRPADDGLELDRLLTPGTTLPQLDAESAYERFAMERIEDVATYATAAMSRDETQRALEQGDAIAPTTPVCVEFAEQANPSIRRWVVFTLRYQPLDETQRLPERWTLSGALMEPPPLETPDSGYCATILDRSAP